VLCIYFFILYFSLYSTQGRCLTWKNKWFLSFTLVCRCGFRYFVQTSGPCTAWRCAYV